MLQVGLTGGTGAGKSTVARRLGELGALVVDADALAREVVAPGTEGLDAVVAEFGDAVLAQDGSLDRAALARLVFADPERRRTLETITHPRIAVRTRELLDAAPPDAVVVHDVPLLVEKRMGARYHLVVVVHAPEAVRVARLASRGMHASDARARVRAQATDAERRAAADVWLDNCGDEAALRRAVDAVWRTRVVPYAENVRARRPAAPPPVVSVVPYDPAWPAQAARVVDRVRAATGNAAESVEHVGSTAVPGLPANDVLDVQLVVADLEVADGLRRSLERAGFARRDGKWEDEGIGGVRLATRLHGACDPGRPVNLHVRPRGSACVRQTLLFREWLRAHDDERDAYAEVKLASAGRGPQDYVAAKAPWIRAALRRAGEL